MEYTVIGICGGTGSGKTTFANRIKECFPDDSVILSMDCYYKNRPDLSYEERAALNYDEPDAIDTDLFISDLNALREGRSIIAPVYDFTGHLRTDEGTAVEPRRIIIVEGILLFACLESSELLDIKVFVDADADVRVLRRARRDVNKRGRTLESVMEQYFTTVKPMHEKYVEPFKNSADIIVPRGGKNMNAFCIVRDALSQRTGIKPAEIE